MTYKRSGIKKIAATLLIGCLPILFTSCKIGGALRDFHSISKNIDDVSGNIKPVDTLMMDATSGLLTELASTDSETKIDTLAARINRVLTQYLNESFTKLDPGPMGSKFTQGAMDPILAEETEIRMKQLIHNLSLQMSHDIAASIADLTSPQNKAKLNSMLMSFLSEANSKMVSAFINRSLRDIEFDSLGNRIANQIIAQHLQPQVDSVIRTAVKAVFDEIRHDQNAKGIFGDFKNVLFLGLGLIGAIMGLLFWWNRRKSMKLNLMLVEAIQELDDNPGKNVRLEVAKKAKSEGLLADLHKLMDQVGLFKRNT